MPLLRRALRDPDPFVDALRAASRFLDLAQDVAQCLEDPAFLMASRDRKARYTELMERIFAAHGQHQHVWAQARAEALGNAAEYSMKKMLEANGYAYRVAAPHAERCAAWFYNPSWLSSCTSCREPAGASWPTRQRECWARSWTAAASPGIRVTPRTDGLDGSCWNKGEPKSSTNPQAVEGRRAIGEVATLEADKALRCPEGAGR
jgi:hypothetical protein